ncbi:hypothetical protein INS49_009532 [Diaporthe citri]|uniref:uncharacterized protein n=1 Tax=Diaporthe citri TaxID=83186 RepID=UPI001C802E9C|nr:uncharacterized protein INS49_009532 [Diaporthe citri]KAG6361307.1 hypothetical protein INS49_009532 [Diaporthe citri]
MKQFKDAVSKISSHSADKTKTVAEENDALCNGEEDISPVWTTGQEFQFYVPWLWDKTPEPPPDKLHPNRRVVRIRRPTDLPGFTEEFCEDWIQESVTSAVKELVDDKEHYFTCTERQLKQWRYDQTKAWKHFNIVQSKCDLPEVTVSGFDGVLAVEMTIVIKEVSIHRDRDSSCLEWLTLPSPGKCIERIKNQVRIHLTPECSMHIHIRPQTMLEFDLPAFKKMASLLWLAEERLDKLYHPARNNPHSPFHRSLRCHSNLARDRNPHVTGLLDDHAAVLGSLNFENADRTKLATIWQASDHHQLRELLRAHAAVGKHDYPAYNFFNLFMASEKQTIEFRKTESTIDAQVIDAWIEVFLLLTDFCMTCSITDFQHIMENLGRSDKVYTTWHLLRDIGCKNATVEALKRKFMQQWLPEEPVSRNSSRAATSTTTSSSRSTTRARLRDAIRDGTERVGGKIAGGYSYGR